MVDSLRELFSSKRKFSDDNVQNTRETDAHSFDKAFNAAWTAMKRNEIESLPAMLEPSGGVKAASMNDLISLMGRTSRDNLEARLSILKALRRTGDQRRIIETGGVQALLKWLVEARAREDKMHCLSQTNMADVLEVLRCLESLPMQTSDLIGTGIARSVTPFRHRAPVEVSDFANKLIAKWMAQVKSNPPGKPKAAASNNVAPSVPQQSKASSLGGTVKSNTKASEPNHVEIGRCTSGSTGGIPAQLPRSVEPSVRGANAVESSHHVESSVRETQAGRDTRQASCPNTAGLPHQRAASTHAPPTRVEPKLPAFAGLDYFSWKAKIEYEREVAEIIRELHALGDVLRQGHGLSSGDTSAQSSQPPAVIHSKVRDGHFPADADTHCVSDESSSLPTGGTISSAHQPTPAGSPEFLEISSLSSSSSSESESVGSID